MRIRTAARPLPTVVTKIALSEVGTLLETSTTELPTMPIVSKLVVIHVRVPLARTREPLATLVPPVEHQIESPRPIRPDE